MRSIIVLLNACSIIAHIIERWLYAGSRILQIIAWQFPIQVYNNKQLSNEAELNIANYSPREVISNEAVRPS